MANKNLFLLVLIALCISCVGVAAQAQIITPMPDDPPPQLELPEMPDDGSGTRSQPHEPTLEPTPEPVTEPTLDEKPPALDLGSEDGLLEPFADPVNSGDLQGPFGEFAPDEDDSVFDYDPAILESSGTWLRRGFWYTEVDVVISDRIWSRDGTELIGQNVGFGSFTTSNGQVVTTVERNSLQINGGQNGAEASPRLKLGRFLFRDDMNRDHAVEFIVYGGGQWSQNGRLDAVSSNDFDDNTSTPDSTTLEVESPVDRGNVSFDDAISSQFEYNSRLNSFELNYHVSSRMNRDHMELEPSGQWVRRAQPTSTKSFIAGIRYFDLSEDLTWSAFGIPDNDADTILETGSYDVRVDNDLIGTQLGLSWTYERARWSLGARVKGGMFLNHSDEQSSFVVTGGVTSGNNSIEDDNISFLTDAGLIAKWHLRPNLSIRAGLEVMYLTSTTLAPSQLNFAPVSTTENIVREDVTFLGGLIGLESYW